MICGRVSFDRCSGAGGRVPRRAGHEHPAEPGQRPAGAQLADTTVATDAPRRRPLPAQPAADGQPARQSATDARPARHRTLTVGPLRTVSLEVSPPPSFSYSSSIKSCTVENNGRQQRQENTWRISVKITVLS